MVFANRQEAGKLLAKTLGQYKVKNPVVIALPRGGVPVGFEIANLLHAPLTVLVVRKIGAPHNPEFGIGAIAEEGVEVLDQEMIRLLGISDQKLVEIITRESEEVNRRVDLYRQGNPLPDLKKRTVILVDDGLATGVTAKAAIAAVKKLKPRELIFAVSVCEQKTSQEIEALVDALICLARPLEFQAVGLWYKEFEQTTDRDVVQLLQKANKNIQ